MCVIQILIQSNYINMCMKCDTCISYVWFIFNSIWHIILARCNSCLFCINTYLDIEISGTDVGIRAWLHKQFIHFLTQFTHFMHNKSRGGDDEASFFFITIRTFSNRHQWFFRYAIRGWTFAQILHIIYFGMRTIE